jgi:hypothetical protein
VTLVILYPFSVWYVCKLVSWAHILWAFSLALKLGVTSVFERIKWPRQDRNHAKNHSHDTLQCPSAMEGAKNMEILRDEPELAIQISKPMVKGKRPLEEPKPTQSQLCLRCSMSGLLNTHCKDWIICYVCHQMGQIAWHCSAQWRKAHTKEKLKPLEPNMGSTECWIWIAKEEQADGAWEKKRKATVSKCT